MKCHQCAVLVVASSAPSPVFGVDLKRQRQRIGRVSSIQRVDHKSGDGVADSHAPRSVSPCPRSRTFFKLIYYFLNIFKPAAGQRQKPARWVFSAAVGPDCVARSYSYISCNKSRAERASALYYSFAHFPLHFAPF